MASGKKTKQSYHHGDLHRALVDAALSLIEEGGVSGFSLREVARVAGVTAAAPYHHFRDKAALLAAVAIEGFRELIRVMDEISLKERTTEAKAKALADAYLAFAVGHPSHYRVMFLPQIKGREDLPEVQAAADASFFRLLSLLQLSHPTTPQEQIFLLGVTAWSTLHGVALLAIDGMLDRKIVPREQIFANAAKTVAALVARGSLDPKG